MVPAEVSIDGEISLWMWFLSLACDQQKKKGSEVQKKKDYACLEDCSLRSLRSARFAKSVPVAICMLAYSKSAGGEHSL